MARMVRVQIGVDSVKKRQIDSMLEEAGLDFGTFVRICTQRALNRGRVDVLLGTSDDLILPEAAQTVSTTVLTHGGEGDTLEDTQEDVPSYGRRGWVVTETTADFREVTDKDHGTWTGVTGSKGENFSVYDTAQLSYDEIVQLIEASIAGKSVPEVTTQKTNREERFVWVFTSDLEEMPKFRDPTIAEQKRGDRVFASVGPNKVGVFYPECVPFEQIESLCARYQLQP